MMHTRVVAALVALAALVAWCAVGAVAQVQPSLQVTTLRGESVVKNGVVNPAWEIGAQGPFGPPQDEYPVFVVSLADAKANQTFTLYHSALQSDILRTTGAYELGTITGAQNWMSSIVAQCASDGVGTVQVTLELTAPVGTQLKWAYTKGCSLPSVNVGTRRRARNIIDMSMAQKEFADWIILDATANFYLFLDLLPTPTAPNGVPNTAPVAFNVTADPLLATIASITYDLNAMPNSDDPSGWIMADPTTAPQGGKLSINMVCAPAATQHPTMLPVIITLTFGWTQALTFTFQKQCGTFNFLPSAIIGLSSSTSDIAVAGHANAAWTGDVGHVYAPNSLAGSVFTFHLRLTTAGPVDAQPYYVAYDIDDPNVYSLANTPASQPLGGVITPGQDIPFNFILTCNTPGNTTSAFQVSFGASYQLIEFAWTYTCVLPLIDVSYEVGPGAMVVVFKENVYQDYVRTAADVDETHLEIFLDDATDAQLASQQYSLAIASYDPILMGAPIVSDPNAGVTTRNTATSTPGLIGIKWDCRVKTSQPVLVSLVVSFGWSTELSVAILKTCAGPHRDDDEGPGGWPAAGIFFFCVFILVVILCFSGCAFRYFKEQRRGWEIIPLHDTLVALRDRCRRRGSTNWSSHDNLSDNQPASSYGNFQSDDSYQANL